MIPAGEGEIFLGEATFDAEAAKSFTESSSLPCDPRIASLHMWHAWLCCFFPAANSIERRLLTDLVSVLWTQVCSDATIRSFMVPSLGVSG